MSNEQSGRDVDATSEETMASSASGSHASDATEEAAVVSERLCAGCRTSSPREDLLRFAVGREAPYLVPDLQRKLGGRGVSVHPTRKCLEAAAKRGGFARALKRNVNLDPAELGAMASLQYEQRAASLLIAAGRRRKLAMGTDAVRAILRGMTEGTASEASSIEALIVAADAEGRRDELLASAARLERHSAVMGTKESLGRLFGRDEVGVLGVLDRGIAVEVVRCAVHASELKSPAGGTPQGKDERGHGGAHARVSEAE